MVDVESVFHFFIVGVGVSVDGRKDDVGDSLVALDDGVDGKRLGDDVLVVGEWVERTGEHE